MSKSDAIEALHAAVPEAATLKNTIRSPLTGTDDDQNWQAVFNGPIPPQILFFSYGSKFTIRIGYTIGGTDSAVFHEFGPNDNFRFTTPIGSTSVAVDITSTVTIERPSTASILVSF